MPTAEPQKSSSSRLIIEGFARTLLKNNLKTRKSKKLYATCVLTATSLECHNKLFPTAPLYEKMGVVRDFTGI